MASTYYGETDRTRGVLVYSTSQTNTAVTITAKTQLEAKSYGYSGYRVNVTIDNTATKTKLSYVPGYYANWTLAFETDNASKTITRTHSAQSIVISSSYKGEGTGDYYAGGKSGSTTVTVTVPAKTSYTVTYNANGGSGGATSDTKWYDETLTISSNAPTRTGYTFAGWNTKSDGTGTNYSAGSSYTTNGALTLYAKWTVNTYTVSYNGNGSTGGSTSAQTKTYGTALTLRSNGFTKTGYTFSKWNTKSDGTGTSYSAGASYTANSAVTLYAIWTINKYTVSYNANGGTGAPSAQTKNYGATLTLSTTKPTKTGATFANWKASNGTTYASGGSYTANESTTMTAQWNAITYTISYNANGGSNAPASETKTYGVAKTITTSIPTKTGYTFTGWSGSNGVSYAKGATIPADVNQNLTLTAQWTTITYSVTYSANGGAGAPGTQSKTYGQALTLSSTVPTRTGYRFTGWSGSNGVTYQAGGTVAANVNQNLTMTAQWTLLTYTVTYNANGGSGAPSAGTKTYGQGFTISNTTPTRSSYNFVGWATSSSATSAQYSAGGTIPASVNQNVTLYAVWETAYVAPKIYYQTEGKIPQINRDATDETKALVAFTWKVFSSTSNTVAIAYRVTGASSYTTLWSASRSTTTGTESQTVSPSGGFDTSKTYDIRISVSDGTQTSYYNGFLSSGFFILNHSASTKGKAVGVGQAPVETNVPNNGRLDIGMDVHLNGGAYFGENIYNSKSQNMSRLMHVYNGKSVSGAGWYRIAKLTTPSYNESRGTNCVRVDFSIMTGYGANNNCLHAISFMMAYTRPNFINESSITNYAVVTKIRYTIDGNGIGYFDIYYTPSGANWVNIDYESNFDRNIEPMNFVAIPSAPPGETVMAEHTFASNTETTYTEANFSMATGWTMYTARLQRVGKICFLSMQASASAMSSAWNDICTLPSECWPSTTILGVTAVYNTTDEFMQGQITSAGVVRVYYKAFAANNPVIRINATYITN